MTDHAPENPNARPDAPSEFDRPAEAASADLTPLLRHLLAGETLSAAQTASAFEAMMTGQVHHGEMGALLALLATRTPTPDEILGAARVMREKVDRVESPIDPDLLVDTAGTGGAPKTFNVSTASSIIAAAGGVPSAKHGNRSRTGRGSAEVLEALGVDIAADRATQARALKEANICFCFAIHHHPATRHVMPVRKALGVPTIFNLLGPLTNPAGARRQVMGIYEQRFLLPIAEALRDLGAINAMVVHSEDGLDEISISAPTHVAHVRNGSIEQYTIDPVALGLPRADRADVTARDLEHAATMVRDVISGADQGPARHMTLLATAATLVVADRACDMAEGLAMAADLIDSGAAQKTLDALIAIR